jgi:HEPN domain-containing protein
VRKEEIEKLFERSRKFKDAAEFHFSRGDYDLAVFNIEQSLQLFLEAKLLEKGAEFPKTIL